MTTLKKLIITVLLTTVTIPVTHLFAAAQKQEQSSHKLQVNLNDTLINATISGDDQAIIHMLTNGADINACHSTLSITPLGAAVIFDHPNIITILLDNNADIDAKDTMGVTALEHAVLKNNIPLITQLLAHNAQVNTQDNYGNIPLSQAIKKNCFDATKLLLTHNANVNIVDHENITPLMNAAITNNQPLIKIVLEHKANIDAPSCDLEQTPLMHASSSGAIDTVMQLLSYNANCNLANSKGTTALMYAAENGHRSIVQLLLKNNAWVPVPDPEIMYPILLHALKSNQCTPEIIEMLLQQLLSPHEAKIACDNIFDIHATQALATSATVPFYNLKHNQLQVNRQTRGDCGVHALANALSIDQCIKEQLPVSSHTIKSFQPAFHYDTAYALNIINPQNDVSNGSPFLDIIQVAQRRFNMNNCCILSLPGIWYTTNQLSEHIQHAIPDYSGTLTHNKSILDMIRRLKQKKQGAVHFICEIFFELTVRRDTDARHFVTISFIKKPLKNTCCFRKKQHPYMVYMDSNNSPLAKQPYAQKLLNFIDRYYGIQLLEQ